MDNSLFNGPVVVLRGRGYSIVLPENSHKKPGLHQRKITIEKKSKISRSLSSFPRDYISGIPCIKLRKF